MRKMNVKKESIKEHKEKSIHVPISENTLIKLKALNDQVNNYNRAIQEAQAAIRSLTEVYIEAKGIEVPKGARVGMDLDKKEFVF